MTQTFADTKLGDLITGGTGRLVENAAVWESGKILPATIETIKKAYRMSVPQTTELAKQLKSSTFEESCRNIYDFITSNVKYKKDTPGREEVRTAARSWTDRFTGVDCEDYAIMSGAILKNMGYQPSFEIVGFGVGKGYAHIFTIAKNSGQTVVIDCTPYMDGLGPVVPFNTRPAGITQTMEVELLNGLTIGALEFENPNMVAGVGGLHMRTPATQMLMNAQSQLIDREINGLGSPLDPGKLRAIRTGILLNGAEDQDMYLGALSVIRDVKANGNMVFEPGTDIVSLGEYVGVLEAWRKTGYNKNLKMRDLEGIGGLQFDRTVAGAGDYLEEGISGWLSKTFKKVKKFHEKVAKKVISVHKTVLKKSIALHKKIGNKIKSGIKTFIKDPLYYLNKLNPATIVIRNSVLLAMRVNIFYFAKKLRWGYLTEEQAKAKGYDMNEFKKLRGLIKTFENIFHKLGGEVKNLKAAIIKGGGGLGLGEIGEPATAASTATAMSVLTAIWAVMKKINFKSLFGKTPSKEEADAANSTVTMDSDQAKAQAEEQMQGEQATTYNNASEEMPTGQKMVTKNLNSNGPISEESGGGEGGGESGGYSGGSQENTVSGFNMPLLLGAAAGVGLLMFAR